MKKVLLLLLVLFAVGIYFFRQQIYLRDPVAKVEMNGIERTKVRVFINASNDVLMSGVDVPSELMLVQHGQKGPGLPEPVKCSMWLVCFLPAPPVPMEAFSGGIDGMTSKLVTFHDANGDAVTVKIY